jgi:methylaspartate mutase epsilon subunit
METRSRTEVKNERLDDAEFDEELARIRGLWPTFRELDMDEIARYHREVVGERTFADAYRKARAERRILLQPRFGVATVEAQAEGMRVLERDGGADLLTMSSDTYSRWEDFAKAAEAVKLSHEKGRSMLNGFPAGVHGLQGTRRVTEATGVPVGGRGATGAPQAYNAMMLAGGATEFNGSALAFVMNVEARMKVPVAIRNTQFIDRMIGKLTSMGARPAKESSTIVSGTVVPPAVAVVCGVIEVLLAAEQGVKHHCVAYPVNSSLIQDVAACRVMREFCGAYARDAGHDDIEIAYAIHQWLGPFPEDKSRALARIAFDSVTAVHAGIDKILVKSSEEGQGTPTNQGNIEGLRATRQAVELARGQVLPDSPLLLEECEQIRRESRAILDAVFELGRGDVAVGVSRAIDSGVYEFPYSVNQSNRGRMLACRDAAGAVRFLDAGNLPLDDAARRWHRERLQSRLDTAADEYDLVIEDIRAAVR